jgi:hypothetical protein
MDLFSKVMKRLYIKVSVYDFVRFFKSEFFSQTWTDVSKNSSKTAEKRFSRNISGKTCSQAICVWATLIQINQDNSALYDELRTRGIGLLMKMSSVGKCNRGRKPTLTENG